MTTQLLLGTSAVNACTTDGAAAPSMLLHCYSQSLPLKHVLRRTWLKSNAAQTVSQGPSLNGRALTKCRQRRSACLLQHWHSWAQEKGRLRQRGQMVHRAHQGFAMRHTWEHWHWIASCKVSSDVNVSGCHLVVLFEAHLMEYNVSGFA